MGDTAVDPIKIVRHFFDLTELQTAHMIIQECRSNGKQPAATLKKMFVEPRLNKIVAKAGQPMDPTYVAYLIEYYFLEDIDG